ncbi:MAG: rod shape-determining protein MreC [Termitinemataceae bacterium]|nr:MAG: rod shape-determining protein MreC [Termitinemataceae bacterium]
MKNGNQKKLFNTDAYVFAGLVIVSFSLLLFSTRSFIVNIKDTGLSAFTGLRGGIHSVSTFFSRAVLSIHELGTLRSDYAELQERLARYEQLERSSADISRENNRLREQLGFSQTIEWEHISAEISGRDPDNLFNAFVINKGKVHGIQDDMPVIAFQNGKQALVGKVVQTAQLESLVLPLFDNHSFVSSRLAQSRYEGIVEGQGSPHLPLLMNSITKRAVDEVNEGDLIVTSGVGGLYPQGIAVGRISSIVFQEDETSLQIKVEGAIDFSKLEYVFVVSNKTHDSAKNQDPKNFDGALDGALNGTLDRDLDSEGEIN